MKRMKFCTKSIVCFVLIAVMLLASVPAFAVGGSSTLAKKGDTYIVNCSGLNVRKGAGMGYGIKTVAKRGTLVYFNFMTADWWNVTLSNGIKGFVDKQYLTPTSQEKTGYYTVISTALNVRNAPKQTAKRVATIKSGATVLVVKLNGDWGYIVHDSVTGWAALKYLKTVGSSATVTCKTLNVRSKPSKNGSIIGTISRDMSVGVIATKAGWAHISYSDKGTIKEGYVSTAYLN